MPCTPPLPKAESRLPALCSGGPGIRGADVLPGIKSSMEKDVAVKMQSTYIKIKMISKCACMILYMLLFQAS